MKTGIMKTGNGCGLAAGAHPFPLSSKHANDGDDESGGDGDAAGRRPKPKTAAPLRAKGAFSWVDPSKLRVTAEWKLFEGFLESYRLAGFLSGGQKHRIEGTSSGKS
jgi:hypothetical protein